MAESIAGQLIKGTQRSIEGQGAQQGQIVQIAQRMEQMQQNRQKLEAQKQQLMQQKVEKFSNTILAGTKIKDPSSRKQFFSKFLPKQKTALGLDEVFDQDSINFITSSDENLLKFKGLVSRTQRGELTGQEAMAIANDPEKFAGFEIGPGEAQELLDAEKGALTRSFQQEKFKKTLGLQEEKFEQTQEARFTDFVNKQNTKVKGAFKDIQKSKQSVRLAFDGLDDILDDLKAGRKPNEQKYNALARGLAKAFNSGAMTDRDVADFKEIQGFLGKGESILREYVIGGVSEERARNLKEIAKITAVVLDKKANEVGKQISSSFAVPEFEGREEDIRKGSGLNDVLTPTLTGKGKKAPAGKQLPPGLTLEKINDATPEQQEAMAGRLGIPLAEIKKQLGAK